MSTRAYSETSNCEVNPTPAGDFWLQRTTYSSFNNEMSSYWIAGATDVTSRITKYEDSPTPADVNARFNSGDEESDEITSDRSTPNEMRRASPRNAYKHVPHKDRPPFIVARRNARERRRVQAVNCAFTRLRKVVPIANNRGKRISKVKTLQTAIDYIGGLQALLKQADMYHDLDIIAYERVKCGVGRGKSNEDDPTTARNYERIDTLIRLSQMKQDAGRNIIGLASDFAPGKSLTLQGEKACCAVQRSACCCAQRLPRILTYPRAQPHNRICSHRKKQDATLHSLRSMQANPVQHMHRQRVHRGKQEPSKY
ncbi:hypothetical protein CBL_01166 [Carabus blaptoides fortunei]